MTDPKEIPDRARALIMALIRNSHRLHRDIVSFDRLGPFRVKVPALVRKGISIHRVYLQSLDRNNGPIVDIHTRSPLRILVDIERLMDTNLHADLEFIKLHTSPPVPYEPNNTLPSKPLDLRSLMALNLVPNLVPNLALNLVPNLVPNPAPNLVPNLVPNLAPNLVPNLVPNRLNSRPHNGL
jgi:hypothetical protein